MPETIFRVHSVHGPKLDTHGRGNLEKGTIHRSWTVQVKEDNRYRDRFQFGKKKQAKKKARELAEENAPATIEIENREQEVFRNEEVRS